MIGEQPATRTGRRSWRCRPDGGGATIRIRGRLRRWRSPMPMTGIRRLRIRRPCASAGWPGRSGRPCRWSALGRRVSIDGHRQERVDERNGVGAGVLGARERHVGDVRRQLGDHGVASPCARRRSPVRRRQAQPNWTAFLIFGQECSARWRRASASRGCATSAALNQLAQTLTITTAPSARSRRSPATVHRRTRPIAFTCRPASRRSAAARGLRARRKALHADRADDARSIAVPPTP